jgi:hypothetical protein
MQALVSYADVSSFFHSFILKAFSGENGYRIQVSYGSPTARNPTNQNKYNIKKLFDFG